MGGFLEELTRQYRPTAASTRTSNSAEFHRQPVIRSVDGQSYELSMLKQKNLTVEITGMSCASCAKRIEDAIGNTNGVSESIVNFATGKATVTGRAPAEEIYKIIEGLGYGIVKEETPAISEKEIAQSEWKKFLVSAILSVPVFAIRTQGMGSNLDL